MWLQFTRPVGRVAEVGSFAKKTIRNPEMKSSLVLAIISLFVSIHSTADELIKPESILGKKELCISDGSSIFIFSPDRKFRLEPFGLSGRTIQGTWAHDSDGLHIVGQWSWINGAAADDDFREMDIHIGYLKDNSRDHVSSISEAKHKIYECYFLIERVEKKKKGEQGGGGNPAKPGASS
jgi:hypothetical protein